MRRFDFLAFVLVASLLALGGCNKSTDAPAEGSGDEAAAAAEGEEAAGDEAAAEGEEAAAEGEEAAAAPTTQPAGEAPAGEVAAAPTGEVPTVTPTTLHGAWNADFTALLDDPSMSPEERQLAAAIFGQMQMTMTFNPDGTLTMTGSGMGEEINEAATYEITSTEGNVIQFTTTKAAEEEGGEAETETMTATFTSMDVVKLSDARGEEIPFNRAQ